MITGAYGVSSSFQDKNLDPQIAGFGANKFMAGLGLLGAVVFSGPIAALSAGVAAGGLLAEYTRQQVSTGLAVNQLNQVNQQAQRAQQAQLSPPLLPDNQAPSAPQPQGGGLFSNLMKLWSQE
ncbi:MAG: hypothetical protein H6739_07835 [Alphaproteobacteria bacterium]|nr:hypothetical protein [Alphaproteobacteria bacterium]